MADMADIEQVEDCWEQLGEVIDIGDVMPVTYVNSAASLKAFCGRHGGIVCTSTNAAGGAGMGVPAAAARAVLSRPAPGPQHGPERWAFRWRKCPSGTRASDELGGNTREAIGNSRVLLWKGHCSVHQMFLPQHVAQFRAKYPGIKILVHPECMMEVVDQADVIGSTSRIIRAVEAGPAGHASGRSAPSCTWSTG